MSTTAPTHPIPAPATLVDCPWCDAAVELEADADRLDCPVCRVVVEFARPARVGDGTRTLAPAA